MLSYSIDTARNSELFDAIHVSTDSLDIAEVATRYGCQPEFMRPADLSGDNVSMMESLRYVIRQYESLGKRFDTVAR